MSPHGGEAPHAPVARYERVPPGYQGFAACKAHKWLGLVIGIQAMLWMVSGAYMAAVDIDFIHGDSRVRNVVEPLPSDLSGLHPVAAVIKKYPGTERIGLIAQRGELWYRIVADAEPFLIDARTGLIRPTIGQPEAIALAKHYYTGDGEVMPDCRQAQHRGSA